jgi:hypothetical protein
MTRSTSSGPSSSRYSLPSATSSANVPVRRWMPASASRRATLCAGLGPEEAERLVLPRHHFDRDVQAASPCALGGEQGQLVQRQGPRGAGRGDEGDRAPTARCEALDRLHDGEHVAGTAEADRAWQDGLRRRPQREQQRVVWDRRAVTRIDLPLIGAHRDQRVGDPAHAAVVGDRLPVVVRHRVGAERLGDRERAVGEVPACREHADASAISGERLQREQPLQGSHATADDYDVLGHGPHARKPAHGRHR